MSFRLLAPGDWSGNEDEIETAWRAIIRDNPWPQAEADDITTLMDQAAGPRDTWSPELHDLWYRLRAYWDVRRSRELAARFDARMSRLTPAQRKRHVHLWIRCPQGCTLLEIYKDPLPEGGVRVYVRAHNRRGVRVYLCNPAVADDYLDPDLWAPIACRHGKGRFGVDTPMGLAFSDLPKGSHRPINGTIPIKGAEHPILGDDADSSRYHSWTAKTN